MQDRLYSVKETCQILHVSKNLVYDLINAGLLPALKLGSLKVREVSIANFLQTYDGCDLSDLSNIEPLTTRKEVTP